MHSNWFCTILQRERKINKANLKQKAQILPPCINNQAGNNHQHMLRSLNKKRGTRNSQSENFPVYITAKSKRGNSSLKRSSHRDPSFTSALVLWEGLMRRTWYPHSSSLSVTLNSVLLLNVAKQIEPTLVTLILIPGRPFCCCCCCCHSCWVLREVLTTTSLCQTSCSCRTLGEGSSQSSFHTFVS